LKEKEKSYLKFEISIEASRTFWNPLENILRKNRKSIATPSNCGEILTALSTKRYLRKLSVAKGNDLGYGNNDRDWIIRSQVLKKEMFSLFMHAVHRLNVGG